jgi:tight adherence protein B
MTNQQLTLMFLIATFLCAMTLFWFATRTLTQSIERYKEKFAEQAQTNLRNMFLFIDSRQLITLNGIVILLLTTLGFLFSGSWVIAAMAFAIALVLPRLLFKWFKSKRQRQIVEQLPDAVLLLAGSLRSGASLNTALGQISMEIRPPIAQEFTLLMREQRFGVPFEEALDNMEKRVPNEEFLLVSAAMRVSRDTGGNLAETLEQLAQTLRTKITLEGKIRALTAQGKLQGIVVGLLPVGLMFVLSKMEPEAMAPLFHSWYGWVTLAVIAILELIGLLIIRKIVNIDV